MVAGAVILGAPISGLKDSKKLTRLQREKLDAEIRVSALAIGLGWVSAAEVDDLGLTAAVREAMLRAVAAITQSYERIIIDGNINFLAEDSRAEAVIGADSSVPEVSAASIVAKVARDSYMAEAARRFPGYGFEAHVGYGTKAHLAALQLNGPTELHRMSFRPVRACAP